jgi:hypothetical protein
VIDVDDTEVLEVTFANTATPPRPIQPQTKMVLDMYATFCRTGQFQAK